MAYMNVDVAGAVVSVLVCGHNAGEAAEVFGRKFHTQLVGFFYCQPSFSHVLGVEGDNPVVGLHLVLGTVFVVFPADVLAIIAVFIGCCVDYAFNS
jgi:hypothetical protein